MNQNTNRWVRRAIGAMWGLWIVGAAGCAPAMNAQDAGVEAGGPTADAGTCSGLGTTWAAGEFYFDGCNTCICQPSGVARCFARACGGDGGGPRPFQPTGPDMCAPQQRQVQVIEYEVRYPCGIPGGPVGVRDGRCQSLCEPASMGASESTFQCARTTDPQVVLCLRDYMRI
jgi:hypothetical protein